MARPQAVHANHHNHLPPLIMDITIALQRAVSGYSLGSEALAAAVGISRTSLLHKVSPTYTSAHCSPEEVVDIQRITGNHGALQSMAEQLGYITLPMPQAQSEVGSEALVQVVKEFGELLSNSSESLSDNQVSDRELARIEKEASEAIAAIHKLVAIAAQMNQQGKPAELRNIRAA